MNDQPPRLKPTSSGRGGATELERDVLGWRELDLPGIGASVFINVVAAGLAERKIHVMRFEFPYMVERRDSGKKRPPNPQRVLLETFREVIAQVGAPSQLIIGGKSMGGRMASLIADELGVRGLLCLGYPFHPPGRPDKLRTEHLEHLATPTIIVQGDRDPFGTREDAASYALSDVIRFAWMTDGEHNFKPRVKSGVTREENLASCIDAVASFVAAPRGQALRG